MGRRAKNKQPPPGALPDATNKPEKRPVKRKAEEELERSHKKARQEKNAQAKLVKGVQLPAKKQKEPSHKSKVKEPTPEESDEDGWEGIADMPDLATSKKYVHAVLVCCLMDVDPSIIGLFLRKAIKGRVWKSWMRMTNLMKKMKCAHFFSSSHSCFVVLRSGIITRPDDLLQASRIDGLLCRRRS